MKQPEPIIVEIKDVGSVLLKSSKQYKRVSIKIKPFEGVEVLFPAGYSPQRALDFVNAKRQWIIDAQKKIKQHENNHTIFDENTDFKTNNFVLSIRKAQRADVHLQLRNGILQILYPEHLPVSNAPIQDAIRYGIEKAMRLEAKKMLPLRLSQLANENGFIYKNIYIKNLKSRWGSCSFENNINLNLQLMRIPKRLIDYVLLHELCHTVEKNHGAGFWKLLDKCTENKAKELAKEMKNYRTQIY